jgi:hypothetical protein
VKGLAELDEKMEPLKEKYWKGRSLPFPILLDATGETLRAFGISAFPTNVLIDPEGRVVPGNPEEILKAKLAELAPSGG